ncbi:efflux RND transporter periplasmic adaptor subunit [Sphingobium sp. AN558]|uniref:efflux RND transporter periplasmic adaptor subunit n=1 Tax=Sphingobium sp. AN558 TaxID=3133442 RepID=UPI0030BF9832
MDRARVLLFGGGAAAAFLIVIFLFSGDDPKQPAAVHAAAAPGRPQPAPVKMQRKDAGSILPPGMDPARPTDCLIEPSQVIRVNSGVEGVIQAIYVDRGDAVRSGQVVAQLRSDVDRATAAAASARAANGYSVRAAASRAAYLASVKQRSEAIEKYLARDAVEEAQANARAADEERGAAAQNQRVAQLEYVQSQTVLAEKTVRSPISGIVTERAMSVGEYRGASASHILTIAKVDPLNVEVFAPIAQLNGVHVGDQVTILPEQPVGGKYLARIKIIDRVFDAASGTFGMRLELPNPGNRLPAGLRCRIDIKNIGIQGGT